MITRQMEKTVAYENDLNLKATELRLGLPGTEEKEDKTMAAGGAKNNKRQLPETSEESVSISKASNGHQHVESDHAAPPSK